MMMGTNNLNRGNPPMTETAVKGTQERINYYTRLVLAFFALLVVIVGSLIAEIRSEAFDILSTIGTRLTALFSVVAVCLVVRINNLIKKLEEQQNDTTRF